MHIYPINHMKKTQTLNVKGTEVALITHNDDDYISLTDMIKSFGDSGIIENWLRNRNTIEFLGIWEIIHNPNFNSLEFEGIRNDAGLNRFSMSAKSWVDKTQAIGVVARAGRYGGTYAHKDIAFEFGSWLSPEFKLYLIKEFQRLKDAENSTYALEWNTKRTLAKINYRIQTEAVRIRLIPPRITKEQESYIYASEADIVNKAVFGLTAKEWRDSHPEKKSGSENIRDSATLEQLVVLANIENINALWIRQNIPQGVRLHRLNEVAIAQLQALESNPSMKKLR